MFCDIEHVYAALNYWIDSTYLEQVSNANIQKAIDQLRIREKYRSPALVAAKSMNSGSPKTHPPHSWATKP